MDTTFLQNQIDQLKTLADAYFVAITAVISGGKKSYRLDTGQSVAHVTKHNIDEFQLAYDRLLGQISTLEARLNGAAGISRPAW